MSATAVLKVARGGPRGTEGESVESPARFDTFEVPYTPGQSILDGLMWIREHADASLAFRFACINANVCKECVMRIDGKNGYACTERLKPGETVLEPLANKRLIRDLACDTVPPKERLDGPGGHAGQCTERMRRAGVPPKERLDRPGHR